MTKKNIFLLYVFFPFISYSTHRAPVAQFTFNTKFEQLSDNYFKPIIVGASLVEDRFGNAQCAYYLHGSSKSYINLGTSSILKPAQGSVSLWFKIENIVYSGNGYQGNPIILTKSHPGNDFFEAYTIMFSYKTQRIEVATAYPTNSDTTHIVFHSKELISSKKWYHVVITWDDSFLRLYINGELNGMIEKNFRTKYLASDSVMIGNSANEKNKRFFNGYIDDIEIYDRELTPREITVLYNAPNPDKYSTIKKWIAIALSILILLIIIISFTSFRFKKQLEKEREKNRMQQRLFEMEMRIVKAQMNPHFIFNAMNSIQHLILKEENENAYMYLLKFSRLLRKIMESTKKDYVILENEIDMLSTYIEIESSRFEDSFRYEIVTDSRINISSTRIPQMLVQPLIENAIWHGLLRKKEKGDLKVEFKYVIPPNLFA